MTFRMLRNSDGTTTTIRLVGQVGSEHLPALTEELRAAGSNAILDLDEVTLLDVSVIRFLNACEVQGIEILNAAPYIRDWILREQDRKE
jgi:hypothetical protein